MWIPLTKNLRLLLLLSFVLLLTIMHAYGQDADNDDDDDDKPAHPATMNPDQKPAGTHFDCPYEKDFQRAQKIGVYTIRLLPGAKESDARCRAAITSPNGKETIITGDWALTVDGISGTDINSAGKPDLVLDGYSGGARCCYSYTIVSLESTPLVLLRFDSQDPVIFEKETDGTTLIRAQDRVFDYFMIPHAQAVIPQLLFRMEGNKLVDVSAQFPEQYDKQIQEARAQLTSADLDQFHNSRFGDRMFTDQEPTVRRVLVIVLNYLYSGRETNAWQALNEFWPPADQMRVNALIRERRERGLLKQLTETGAAQQAATRK
jgi:hypothetical protein